MILSDYFEPGAAVHVARAPARLDVMGGIADYSGSLVLEGTLGRHARVFVATHSRPFLRTITVGISDPDVRPDASFPLAAFHANGHLVDYDAARAIFSEDPSTRWTSYVGGCLYVLLAETKLPCPESGIDIVLVSNIPLGAGVASSAAIEVATMVALTDLLGLKLDDLTLASLCQAVENRIVGAPCGIMDQVTCALGEPNKLLALKCQPHKLQGMHLLPTETVAVGINSNVRHCVAGKAYTRARVAAFMGLGIIGHRAAGEHFGGYLCNINPETFASDYQELLPQEIRGQEYLDRYGETPDTVTRVDPEETYRIRSCSEHPIYENDRVHRFLKHLQAATGKRRHNELVAAGELMYESHDSYGNRCSLGCPETDFIVDLVRKQGPENGLFGAKITGGGGGGTVAVLLEETSLKIIDDIVAVYSEETGVKGEVFTGTLPGALRRRVDRAIVEADR